VRQFVTELTVTVGGPDVAADVDIEEALFSFICKISHNSLHENLSKDNWLLNGQN
jgi:hypothetical protein